jgi:hypothetical protein
MSNKRKKVTQKEMVEQVNALKNIEKLIENANTQTNIPLETRKKPTYIQYGDIKVDVDSIKISDHSFKRSKERLGFQSDKQIAGELKGMLKKSKLIGRQVSEEGNEAILFAHGRTGLFLSPCLKTVVTVTRHETVTYEPLKNKLVELHAKEYRKLERKENARLKQLVTAKLEAEMEISQCKYRSHRTKSIAIKNVCQARINAVTLHIQELENEITNIQSEKRQVGRSMISVI